MINVLIAVLAIAIVAWAVYSNLLRRQKSKCNGAGPAACSHCATNEFCSTRGPRLIEVDEQGNPVNHEPQPALIQLNQIQVSATHRHKQHELVQSR
jgi:hypothetical protein